jgi:hypothetical protein
MSFNNMSNIILDFGSIALDIFLKDSTISPINNGIKDLF